MQPALPPTQQAIRTAFHTQAEWCDRLGSPFTARLMRLVEPLLGAGSEIGLVILKWQGNPDALHDSVPLRLAGALHALARSGQKPAWSALYPPANVNDAALTEALATVLHDPVLLPWLSLPPQTNEVARASLLYAGMIEIARRTACKLSLFELGASAGLNLQLDRFSYNLGGRQAGDLSSPVRLAPQWQGAAPRGPNPLIIAREGNDLAPLDVSDDSAAERLMAYIWADQHERLARTQAAIHIARAYPPHLVKADAADWLEQALHDDDDDVCRVLYHSIAFQYLPPASKTRVIAHMQALAARATPAKPLAWLSFEIENTQPVLRLKLWPHQLDIPLATADAHGRQITWLMDQG